MTKSVCLIFLLLLSCAVFGQIDNIKKEAEKGKSGHNGGTTNFSSGDTPVDPACCMDGCVAAIDLGPYCAEGCEGLFSAIGNYHQSIIESNPSATGLNLFFDGGRGDKFNARYLNGQLRGSFGLFGIGLRYWYFTDNYGYQPGVKRKAELSGLDLEFLHLNLVSLENFTLRQINSYTSLSIVDSKGKPETVAFYDLGGMMGLYSNKRKFGLEVEYRAGIGERFIQTPRAEFSLKAIFHPSTSEHFDFGFFVQYRNQSYFGVTPYNFLGAGLSFWLH
jgi:hypothetical protein